MTVDGTEITLAVILRCAVKQNIGFPAQRLVCFAESILLTLHALFRFSELIGKREIEVAALVNNLIKGDFLPALLFASEVRESIDESADTDA